MPADKPIPKVKKELLNLAAEVNLDLRIIK
jgi:hypothetical protein